MSANLPTPTPPGRGFPRPQVVKSPPGRGEGVGTRRFSRYFRGMMTLESIDAHPSISSNLIFIRPCGTLL
jgi:hypothetical protein